MPHPADPAVPHHPAQPDRRAAFGGWGLAAGVGLFATSAQAAGQAAAANGMLVATQFGAVGDGRADDTAALQRALDAAGRTGGAVLLTAGNYLVRGALRVPPHVTVEGVFRSPTARTQGFGTTVLAVGGKGRGDGQPLFLLEANAGLRGLTVFYPEQDPKAPVEYPWCVRGRGDNVSLTDVLLVNPWTGVDFGTYPCGRHLVRGLYGQPLLTGLFVDQCLDCGRLADVHFWPFWTNEPLAVSKARGTAFRFARTDWQMVTNTFCLGYRTGYQFTAVRHDAGNALLTNSGADDCAVAVHVEYSQVQAGIHFANCQINAGVRVERGSLGPVKFVGCGLFATGFGGLPYLTHDAGHAAQGVLLGQGRTTFMACHFYHPEGPFVPTGFVDPGHPVVFADGGGLTVSGCDFTGYTRHHLRLGPKATSTLVTGTRARGGVQVVASGPGKVVMGQNIDE